MTPKSMECMYMYVFMYYLTFKHSFTVAYCLYITELDNSNPLTAFRYMLAQMGPSEFNEVCGPYLD